MAAKDAELAALRASLAQQLADLAASHETQLDTAIEDMNNDAIKMQKACKEQLTKLRKEHKDAIKKLQKEFNSQQQQLEIDCAELKSQLEEADAEAAKLNSQLDKANAKLAKEKSKNKAAIAELEAKLAAQGDQTQESAEQLAALQAKLNQVFRSMVRALLMGVCATGKS